ncbi:hypothetical protein COS83_01405 [archaeon CG07_land_8_20_14_0_80_38_8]|nr:MAG: hypothetical protein COS83_01405 [archaeon CG07_land_8_20_14_0_80_38_8]PIU88170.1 MAG: hypothetical protein COS64_04535 [archaeon CG06_land_8_20_14_3_00_37_11]
MAKSQKKEMNKNIGKIEFLYITQAVLFLVLAALVGVEPTLLQYVVMTALVILAISSVVLAYEWVNIETNL